MNRERERKKRKAGGQGREIGPNNIVFPLHNSICIDY